MVSAELHTLTDSETYVSSSTNPTYSLLKTWNFITPIKIQSITNELRANPTGACYCYYKFIYADGTSETTASQYNNSTSFVSKTFTDSNINEGIIQMQLYAADSGGPSTGYVTNQTITYYKSGGVGSADIDKDYPYAEGLTAFTTKHLE